MAPMGSMAAVNRPRLTVQIPDDDRSDDEETAAAAATAGGGSSPGSGGTIMTAGGGRVVGGMPTSATTLVPREGGQVVLPPPSPSAGALLSAGAHGPPNPFARPNPPPSMTTAATSSGNSIETPISALPSRITADGGLITSPNTLLGYEWGFGRGNPTNNGGGPPGPGDFNLLPSPINLPAPLGVMPSTTAGPHAVNFDRDRNRPAGVGGLKRKSPEVMDTSTDDVAGQTTRVAAGGPGTIPTSVVKKIKI